MTSKFLMDNIFLIAIALISGGMLIAPYLRLGTGGGASVSTLQATMLINQQDALIVDLREDAEFAKGHIINARNLPLAKIDERVREIERWKEKPVIVHDATGTRAGSALALLKKHGFNNVVQLSGGFAAWQQAGLPTAKS